jgi:hypothetical protein
MGISPTPWSSRHLICQYRLLTRWRRPIALERHKVRHSKNAWGLLPFLPIWDLPINRVYTVWCVCINEFRSLLDIRCWFSSSQVHSLHRSEHSNLWDQWWVLIFDIQLYICLRGPHIHLTHRDWTWSSKQPSEYVMINLSIPFVQSLNLEFQVLRLLWL